jgi:predicted metal-dependent TIM-barrel fold hydrolase
VLAPANHARPETVRELAALGAHVEFSFFFVSHATAVGLTHVDAEKHRIAPAGLHEMVERIDAAPPEQVILSSDCGVSLLPPPVEGLREFLLLLEAAGLARARLRPMVAENPRRLFRVSAPSPARSP